MIDLSKIEEITYEIDIAKDEQKEIALVSLALNLIEDTKEVEDTEYHYFIGFFWYLHPIKNQERFDKIIYHLKKSIALDNSHEFSKFYLGCIYFDNKFYQEALYYYELIDLDYFTIEIEQLWRAIKIEELIIACHLYLEDDFISIHNDKIIKLLDKYHYHYIINYDFPINFPQEIIESLFFCLQNYQRNNAKINKVIRTLIMLIEKADLLDVYHDAYSFFKKLYSEIIS